MYKGIEELQIQLTQLIKHMNHLSQPDDIDRVVCDVKHILLEAAEINKVVYRKSKQPKHIYYVGTIKKVKVKESRITHSKPV